MSQVTANGNTYSDDGSAAIDMGNGGHRNYLLPMLGDTIVECDAAVSAAVAAAASESAALGSATAAQNYAAALKSTSTSSLAVGTGSKTFTTQASKQYAAGQWVTASSQANSANYMFGQVTSYSGTTLIVNVTATGGSGTLADWNISIAGVQGPQASGAVPLLRSARTSNTVLGVADIGTLIDITSGTFTQTFSAAATLGNGWWCYIKNSGAGDITLDPNASETIDGLTSFVMYPGEVRLIQCDGSVLRSVVVNAFAKNAATSFTFTKPPGYSAFGFHMFGGGGGGGGGARIPTATQRCGSGGGGGGGLAHRLFPASVVPSSVVMTIGAGGAGGTGAASDGGSGIDGSYGGSTVATGLLAAIGGRFGVAGSTGTTAASGGAMSSYPSGESSSAGGAGTNAVGTAAAAVASLFSATGGGGGGGAAASSTTARDGGTGGGVTISATTPGRTVGVTGSPGGTPAGAAAVVGADGSFDVGGTGGGGGAYITATAGKVGANGGWPGGGGGGAGACDNGNTAAAGGTGGAGAATIWGVI